GASREAGWLDADLLAVPVAALDDHGLGALHLAHPSRIAQASLVTDLSAILLHDLRIDQAPDLLVVALDDTHTQGHADLVGCEPGARRLQHGLGQVVEETLNGGVHARDFLRLFAEHGIFKGEDRPAHAFDSTRGVRNPNL